MVEVKLFTTLGTDFVVEYQGHLYYLSNDDIYIKSNRYYTYPNKLTRRYEYR